MEGLKGLQLNILMFFSKIVFKICVEANNTIQI